MKSKSMSAQGSATLACVCRCSSGLRRASSPPIHILAGLKVCIQAVTPMTESSRLASSIVRRIESASVSTGFQTSRTGTSEAAASSSAIAFDWSATCCRVSSP